MKLVHTEIFLNKTIDVFEEYDRKYYRCIYTAKIDGELLVPRGGGVSDGRYYEIKKAVTSAKLSIRKNLNKADEIAKLEAQIAELQARLEKLRG